MIFFYHIMKVYVCKFEEKLKERASVRLQKRFIHNFLSIQQIYFQKMYTTSTDLLKNMKIFLDAENIYWKWCKNNEVQQTSVDLNPIH